VFSSWREHLLVSLLSLEFIVLGIFFIFFNRLNFGVFYSLFYLVVTACEGALGLSILVVISRSWGGDFFKSFNLII
jgi:NADH-ubiquinone oxidoreductase chain 4L